ncbi:MAG: hypothetical protein ACWA5P_07505 [bacterium]
MKNSLKSFLKEIISITIGILFALYINNWNEDRKDQLYISRISETINNELIETKKEIEEKFEKQKILIDSLSYYENDENLSIDEITRRSTGIHIPTIKINSWKAISNSKIELMDYNKVSVLADIESQKELISLKAQKLLDYIYANFKSTESEKKQFLKVLMIEVMSTEVSLKQDIEKLIDK